MFTEAELSLICIHIGKLHTEKVIERIEVPTDLVELLVDTVYEYQMKSIKRLATLVSYYKRWKKTDSLR